MVKVKIHVADKNSPRWEARKVIEVSRVPVPGECVSVELMDSPGYEVIATNHHAFEHPDGVVAELYVSKITDISAFLRSKVIASDSDAPRELNS